MTHDERNGLIILVAFLLVSAAICTWTTDSGRAISNIFSNIVSYADAPPSPALEAQFEPLKQQMAGYWLPTLLVLFFGIITLIATLGYLLIRRQVPRSWCLLLILIGIAGILLSVAVSSLNAAILAVPVPNIRFYSATHDELVIASNTLGYNRELSIIFVLIGLALLVLSLTRPASPPEPKDEWIKS